MSDERVDDYRADGGSENGSRETVGHETTVIARTIVRLVVPIILVTAIALLLQGHNRPGGGFIGAVLTATAVALGYVVFGVEDLQVNLLGSSSDPDGGLIERYRWLFAAGLAIAVGSMLVPGLVGAPLFTQGILFVEHLPIYGELEVASALAFDLGVYLAVVGAVLTAIAEVGAE